MRIAEFLGGVRFSCCSNLYQEQCQSFFFRCICVARNLKGEKICAPCSCRSQKSFLTTILLFRSSIVPLGPHRENAPTLLAPWFRRCVSIPHHSKNSKDHPKDNMKVQALLAKEEKPEEQDQHSLHVAKDLKRYSGEPADADELAQIYADGNEA